MREDLLIQRVREAMRKYAARPPQEIFEDMVRRGVIDEKGRVLLRCPEPPRKRKPKANSRKRAADEEENTE
jgi:hypothetical protein